MAAKRVLKYPIRADVIVPVAHKFLHADIQDGEYVMWLEVEMKDQAKGINNQYMRVPTDLSDIPENGRYCCTIVNGSNNTVWHVYDTRAQP